MNDLVDNIAQNFSIEEIIKLQALLKQVQANKENRLSTSNTLYNFYLEYCSYIESTFSRKYLISVKQSFKHLIKCIGEEKKLEEITARDAETFKMNLLKTAPKGTAIYLRTLKASFNKAMEWDYISYNPFSKIISKKNQQIKPIFITRKELQTILDHTKNGRMKQIFIFAFNSGCRLREIVNMKWSNIDLVNEIIIVGDTFFTTKNKKQRVVPFSPELQLLLPELKRKSRKAYKYLFHKDSDFPFCGEYVSKHFKNSLRKAGLSEDIHFHTLRHSFGSNLANKGVPIVAIKEMMGHSNISTTEIYSHTNLENLQREIAKLNVA